MISVSIFFSFPVEMMVVKNTGEVVVHYNANKLLKVAEESGQVQNPFSWVCVALL